VDCAWGGDLEPVPPFPTKKIEKFGASREQITPIFPAKKNPERVSGEEHDHADRNGG
jgi:hypothetical protein